MAFLYGDSTPSPLQSNFLEFLRDALDFAVHVLQVDANIEKIRDLRREGSLAAEEEIQRLREFGRIVMAAIDEAPKGEEGSETSRCAAQHRALSTDTVNASIEAVKTTLAAEVAQAERDETAQRDASFKALETLLLPHAPPESTISTSVERRADGSFAVSLIGDATLGLHWRIEFAIPDGHVLSGAPLSIERLSPLMEFSAPEQTGWLKKETKPRPQRLDKFVLTEATDDGHEVVLKLRAVAAGDQGFAFAVDPASGAVRATKTSGKDGDVDFDLSAEDTPKIVALAEKLRAAIAELKGGTLVEATLDSAEYKVHPIFRDVVERLVTKMTPIVQEIARHSLTQTELVIRRLLSNERREEIFLAKTTLREKYAPLPRDQRALFDSFGFDTLPPPGLSGAPGQIADVTDLAESVAPAALRSELPPSQPPPPPSWEPPPAGARPSWRKVSS
jgi:hypothetical protein